MNRHKKPEYQIQLNLQSKVNKPEDIDTIIDLTYAKVTARASNRRKIKYYEIPASFDIETTSFYDRDGQKSAIMYEWSFSIAGHVIIGRTWQEWLYVCKRLSERSELSERKRIIIYVHNLSYEFQFMRKWFEWVSVFAVDERKPVYAITTDWIEFRCSYILSGYSLAKVGENLTHYECKKLVGDLDYDLIRHAETHLTEQELSYCINDVQIVVCYIQELIEQHGSISKLPLTKTGFVRDYCRERCFYTEGMSHLQSKRTKKYNQYKDLMHTLTLTPEQYTICRRAFQGGFTHCNPAYMGEVMENVTSFDFTSSYPATMVSSNRFPMSRGEWVKIESKEEFYKNLKCYCCIFDIKFNNLQPRVFFDNYISYSHCWDVVKPVLNNGRVVSAESLRTTITEVDFAIIQRFYTWDSIQISNMLRFERDYLPTDFVKSILDLYKNKTELKDVDGKEVEYMWSKSNLNSTFGMAVTDIAKPEQVYDNENQWGVIPADLNKLIDKYNRNGKRFLFYPWGVYITALSRMALFTGILEFGFDYIYADTDSIKVINVDKHTEYIDRYNRDIGEKLKRAMEYHGLPDEYTHPKTVEGVEKPLGVWDKEVKKGRVYSYTRFKSLGAKRYMVDAYGDISITVSGLNKKVCVPYLVRTFGKEVFSAFNDDLYIPEEYTGKKTHTYIDDERAGTITDYTGKTFNYFERSGVHLSGSDYSLSIASQYAEYTKNIKLMIDPEMI